LMVVEVVWKWLQQLSGFSSSFSAHSLLTDVDGSPQAKYLLEFLFHYGLFYWNLRQPIRIGNENAVTFAWQQSWPIFHATKKKHYAKISMIATYVQHFTHPSIHPALSNRLCNLKGIPTHYIGPYMLTEKVH